MLFQVLIDRFHSTLGGHLDLNSRFLFSKKPVHADRSICRGSRLFFLFFLAFSFFLSLPCLSASVAFVSWCSQIHMLQWPAAFTEGPVCGKVYTSAVQLHIIVSYFAYRTIDLRVGNKTHFTYMVISDYILDCLTYRAVQGSPYNRAIFI